MLDILNTMALDHMKADRLGIQCPCMNIKIDNRQHGSIVCYGCGRIYGFVSSGGITEEQKVIAFMGEYALETYTS
jgi:hypothetical protein